MQQIKDSLTPAQFLAANPLTNTLDVVTWPYTLPLDAPFRCHNDLTLTRDHVRAYCSKRSPERGCTCLTLELRDLPASDVLAAEPSPIFTPNSLATVLPTNSSSTP